MLQQNEFDVFENKKFVVNFKFKNYKNNLHHVFDKFELKNFDILNNRLYIDFNDIKKDSYLKLMFAICNYKKTKKLIKWINSFVIIMVTA